MHNDDDSDHGLSGMMARAVSQTTSRSRGRSSDGMRDSGGARSRSRSSSILRRIRGSKKKDSAPATPRRDRSRDTDDDNKSVASRKSVRSTRSKAAKSKKKTGQSLTKTKTTTPPPEILSPKSTDSGGKEERKKSKKKSKKIKRIRKPGSEDESGDDEYTIVSKQSTKSTKSSKSAESFRSKASKVSKVARSKNTKNKVSKQYKETSSRVDAIREPVKSNAGVIIQDEMDSLFPLPNSTVIKTGKAMRATSVGKSNNIDTDNDDMLPKSTIAPQSQKSLNSSNTGGSTSSFGIMTNKAAEEQAEAALSRVAKKEMNNSNSGSEPSRGLGQYRRYSNDSSTSRSREQYERLHRDSGLTSLTSNNDDDDARSYSSSRRQSSYTAMSALHKRMDEYKIETESLQKRLYEALAEVEQKNVGVRKEKKRADLAEGDLNNVKSELEKIHDEKSFLIESVRDMETEFVAKNERVDKLQEVVEMQLDTVEFLEEKLNKTEEELIVMEDEMSALIVVVEEKNKSNEQINEVVSRGQGRMARVESMREEMINRKGSIKMKKEESRRVLLSSEDQGDRPRRKGVMSSVSEDEDDANQLDNDLETRKEKLKADEEKCDEREQRLDTWERELFDLEDQLKKDSDKSSEGNEKTATKNLEQETLITSLEKEKERLRIIQIDTQSKFKKLEFENEDLRVKLDRVTKMTVNVKELPGKSKDLKDALALVKDKTKVIQSLEEKIDKLGKKDEKDKNEEEGKDLLIRELQNQLVNTKKEANSLSSGSYVTRLKIEIKKLRESVKNLKKKVKDEEAASKLNMQRKDDSMKLLQKQMEKLKIELERREKREKNFGTHRQLNNSDLQNHIEDLEDEISHWKSTNADLEMELESLKCQTVEPQDYYLSDDDIDDDCSIGSLASVNSRMSLSVTHEDNFFLTDSTHSNMSDDQAPNGAMQRVSNLWSKMRNGPEPPNTVQGFPYAPGSLND